MLGGKCPKAGAWCEGRTSCGRSCAAPLARGWSLGFRPALLGIWIRKTANRNLPENFVGSYYYGVTHFVTSPLFIGVRSGEVSGDRCSTIKDKILAYGGDTLEAVAVAGTAFKGLTALKGLKSVEGAAKTGVKVASSAGGESLPMSMVRPIQRGETIADLTNEVKALAWQTGNEHAVVTLANGQRAIVSGGPGGINFAEGQIKTLFGHTHPTAAPPSAADVTALQQLGQSHQTVLHGGQVTKVRPNH